MKITKVDIEKFGDGLPDPWPPSPARPFIKWVGGKGELAPEIAMLMPEKISRYIEPFAGGGAMFFHLRSTRPMSSFVLSDQLDPLMNAYQVVQFRSGPLIERLRVLEQAYHESNNQADMFRTWRASFNEMAKQRKWSVEESGSPRGSDPAVRADAVLFAALFIALNKTCFNGLWRVNQKGEMNVPPGSHRMTSTPTICNAEGIEKCAKALELAVVCPAQNAFDMMMKWFDPRCARDEGWEDPRGATVFYLDPPYIPSSKTSSFVNYSGAFGEGQHRQLEAVAGALVLRGHTVVASNSDTPLTREIWASWEKHEIAARRSVAAKAGSRAPVGELVMVGRPR